MTTDVVLDELEVARAIAAGNIPSPQRLGDMSLYAMRVSGTGVSYRRGIDEYVWRDPGIYLSQAMIDRCSGLPVIWEHPEKSMLNSEEFANRVVGTVMFAYPKGDELWGITRIYDKEAIEMMDADQLSTSPAVVFKDPTVNSKIDMADGSKMLIEGKPSLLDHLAVCAKGVWDKGGEPTGVRSDSEMSVMEANLRAIHALSKMDGSGYAPAALTQKTDTKTNFPPGSVPQELAPGADKCGQVKDSDMAEEKKVDAEREEKKEDAAKADAAKADAAKADAAKKDADAGQKIDKILECLDGMSSRFDALSSRMDAYESKKDAEKSEEEKGKSEKLPFTKDSKEKDAEEEKEEKGEPKEMKADKKKDGSEAAMVDKKAKDADEKEEEEKKDAARMDSANEHLLKELQKQVNALNANRPRELTDADRDAISAAQAKADGIYSAFGDSAPRPMQNELPLEYRRRVLMKLQTHSPTFKDEDIRAIAMVPKAFQIAEDQIFKDAWTAATTPEDIDGIGGLREVRRVNRDTGHVIKEYYGNPMAWMSQFTGGRRLARFNLGKVRGDR